MENIDTIIGTNLKEVITSNEGVKVVLLDGKYGIGKTSELKKMCIKLKEENRLSYAHIENYSIGNNFSFIIALCSNLEQGIHLFSLLPHLVRSAIHNKRITIVIAAIIQFASYNTIKAVDWLPFDEIHIFEIESIFFLLYFFLVLLCVSILLPLLLSFSKNLSSDNQRYYYKYCELLMPSVLILDDIDRIPPKIREEIYQYIAYLKQIENKQLTIILVGNKEQILKADSQYFFEYNQAESYSEKYWDYQFSVDMWIEYINTKLSNYESFEKKYIYHLISKFEFNFTSRILDRYLSKSNNFIDFYSLLVNHIIEKVASLSSQSYDLETLNLEGCSRDYFLDNLFSGNAYYNIIIETIESSEEKTKVKKYDNTYINSMLVSVFFDNNDIIFDILSKLKNSSDLKINLSQYIQDDEKYHLAVNFIEENKIKNFKDLEEFYDDQNLVYEGLDIYRKMKLEIENQGKKFNYEEEKRLLNIHGFENVDIIQRLEGLYPNDPISKEYESLVQKLNTLFTILNFRFHPYTHFILLNNKYPNNVECLSREDAFFERMAEEDEERRYYQFV